MDWSDTADGIWTEAWDDWLDNSCLGIKVRYA